MDAEPYFFTPMCVTAVVSVESVEHILSTCTPVAPTMYLRRHNEVLKILHRYLIGSHSKDYWRDQTRPLFMTLNCLRISLFKWLVIVE